MVNCNYIPLIVLVILFLFGCTESNPANNSDFSSNCPSTLQACGEGCIPTNAICCNDDSVNGFCLQPSFGCGDGVCYSYYIFLYLPFMRK